jgi:hypothetical protein
MKKFDLFKEGSSWNLKAGKEVVKKLGTVKTEAVSKLAKTVTKEGGGSVRIRNTDGTISEERTYPRSADPRSSKG